MQEFNLPSFVAGFWRLDEWQQRGSSLTQFIEQLLALGIDTVDHADIYGQYQCEKLFGEALTPHLRDQLKVITKCGIKPAWPENGFAGKTAHYDSSKANIIASAEQSLRNFKTDRLDVLLIHRPDYLMHADEVADAFCELKAQGKVLNFGVSNFTVSQFELLQSRLDFKLVTNQIEMSPLQMGALEDGTLNLCQQHQISPMLWSPLAGGGLFAETEQAQRVRTALHSVAEEAGLDSVDQAAYAWLLTLRCQPSVILGTGKLARIQSAVAASKVRLSREQWYRVWQASTGHSVP